MSKKDKSQTHDRPTLSEGPNYLSGQLLVAMPQLMDSSFERTVIYMCAHNADGALGLVINKLVESLTFDELLSQLDIEPDDYHEGIHVHFGGPVEAGRGFVLHSADYLQESSLQVDDHIALTATIDILKDMANGRGPSKSFLALGYAGWGPGQLDREIQDNGWLNVASDDELLFGSDLENKWEKAISKIGFDVSKLSHISGHA